MKNKRKYQYWNNVMNKKNPPNRRAINPYQLSLFLENIFDHTNGNAQEENNHGARIEYLEYRLIAGHMNILK